MDFTRKFLYKSRVCTGGLSVCHKSDGSIGILPRVSTSLCSQTSEKTFYEEYVNLNTLNFQNLKECRKIKECSIIEKTDMTQKEYTFAEIKLFTSCPDRGYIRLYHKLNYRRVDDRLRVMQEVVKKRLLEKENSEETLEAVAAF